MSGNIGNNLLQIQREIAPYTPNIIAVTKYYGLDGIVNAYTAGLRDFGESRAIESIEKINNLPKEIRENSRFHFIGHLQSNKAEKVVKYFDYIHSVDSLKLARIISNVALREGKKQKVLLQVNNALEPNKYGYSREELEKDFKSLITLEGLEVIGIMNIAPIGEPAENLNKLFSDINKIKRDLEAKYNYQLKEISMGMSDDYKEAVANGATMIRIGRKLFN